MRFNSTLSRNAGDIILSSSPNPPQAEMLIDIETLLTVIFVIVDDGYQAHGHWDRPFLSATLPLQFAAFDAIALNVRHARLIVKQIFSTRGVVEQPRSE